MDLSGMPAMPADGAMWSGYDGAQRSPTRGEVFFPELDTRLELDAFSREELLRRIRWLYTNTGLVGGMVDNGADLIGWQRPRMLNEDPEYVIRAQEVIDERMGTAEVFDYAGNFNLEDCQPMLSRLMLKDADAAVVMTQDRSGGAQFAFYEAHQLCDPPNASSKWRDGVRYEGNRRVAYGFRDGETGKVSVIEAKHVLYYGELKSPGHGRATPRLARAVNHAIDITEVFGFIKAALKTAALWGAVIEREGNSVPVNRQGMLAGEPDVAISASGAQFETSKVWNPAQIPELPAGRKIKILVDQRPSPDQMKFIRELVRDASIGFGLPPEVLWHMIDLTGPGVRFVMDVADNWIKGRQRPQKTIVERMVRRTLACEIDRGRLAISERDRRWWKMKLVPKRSLTIDRGQVSRARLDEIDAGVGTWDSWTEIDGADWMDRADQRMRETAYVKATAPKIGKEFGVELSHEEVFKGRQGAAAVDVKEDPEPDPKTKDDKKP